MSDITKMPYAVWLEECIANLMECDPQSICVAWRNKDGYVMTGYYNCDATDKAVLAHNIQSDIVMDIFLNNIDAIREALEETDGD